MSGTWRPGTLTTCAECGFDWDLGPAEALAQISTITSRFRDAVISLSDDALRARPEPDVWSPLQYLAHTRDVIEFYDKRIERVITEDQPTLAVDWTFAELAESQRYSDQDSPEVLDALTANAEQLGRRLLDLDAEQWQLSGIGSSGQQRTVLDLARRGAHEAQHHLVDIARQAPER